MLLGELTVLTIAVEWDIMNQTKQSKVTFSFEMQSQKQGSHNFLIYLFLSNCEG